MLQFDNLYNLYDTYQNLYDEFNPYYIELVTKDKNTFRNAKFMEIPILHALVFLNRFDIIEKINKNILKYAFDTVDDNENNPFHIAAMKKLFNILNYFMEIMTVDNNYIYKFNSKKATPLWYIIKDNKFMSLYIGKKYIKDNYIIDNVTILQYYIHNKHIDAIHFLLNNDQNKFNPNFPTNSPPILLATILSDEDESTYYLIIKLLLSVNANLDVINKIYDTPLIIATLLNKTPIVKLFLNGSSSKCNINFSFGLQNEFHPLLIAIFNNNIELIKLFIDNNISLKYRNISLQTPVHFMYYKKLHTNIPLELKIKMVDMSKRINWQDEHGNSILFYIFHSENWKEFTNILVNRKLKIYSKNKDGLMPINGIKKEDLDDFYKFVAQSYVNVSNSIGYKIDDIINKIKNGESYPKKINKKKFNLIKFPITNFNRFYPHAMFKFISLYFLLNKYSNLKIPFTSNNINFRDKITDLIDPLNVNGSDVSRLYNYDLLHKLSPKIMPCFIHCITQKSCTIQTNLIDSIKNVLVKYPNTEFILFLSDLRFESHGHANILIYDVKNKFIERFDPENFLSYNVESTGHNIDLTLKKFFEENLTNVKYYGLNKICNEICYQAIEYKSNTNFLCETSGYCQAWVFFYLEMRITNPHLNPKKLIQMTINAINKFNLTNGNLKFTDYILSYAHYIYNEYIKIIKSTNVIPDSELYKIEYSDDITSKICEAVGNKLNQFL
jgi:ankyrin repeat protein